MEACPTCHRPFLEDPTCKRCGQIFGKLHGNQRYCSDKCRFDVRREANRRWWEETGSAARKTCNRQSNAPD
jgi:hypothetical protein